MYGDEDFDKRLTRIEADERARRRSGLVPAVLLLAAGGFGAVYYFSDKQDKATGDVILPTVLAKAPSEGRRELGLLTRSTAELAGDINRKIKKGGPENRRAVERFRKRLAQNHDIGRHLEPKLTREEGRVLTAEQHAEIAIGDFLKGALTEDGYDHSRLERAMVQVKRAKELANGEADSNSLLAKVGAASVVKDAVNLKKNLDTIKKARGNESVPEDAR